MDQIQESSVQSQIKEYSKRPLLVGILTFVVGLIIGMVVLGWWLWPVQWYDASPANLHPGYQDMWLQMAINSYGYTGDAATAKVEYDALGDAAADTLARVKANPQGIEPNLISQFEAVVSPTAQVQPATVAPGVTPTATPATSGKSNLTTLLIVMCVVTLLVGAALVIYFVLQSRKKASGSEPATQLPATDVETPAEWANYPAPGEQAPMAQFMASYKAGDDLFDDSFSIDSPSGEFLGECGVGISETIGVGVPKKVTAFEVWLFDKNDIQTVTKVLMSAHAFNDPTIRQRLEAKGEPFQANSGGQTILETATLRLVARVVDMTYGQGALPESSYFDSLVLELAIWQKQ
jgi:flagellar basal body-associated protein FliL